MTARHATALAAALAVATIARAQQPATTTPSFAAPDLSERGVRAMAANCASCHGTDGRTAPDSAVAELAGRRSEELVRIMAEFRSGSRPATIMHQIVKGYTDAELAAMADFFSKQKSR